MLVRSINGKSTVSPGVPTKFIDSHMICIYYVVNMLVRVNMDGGIVRKKQNTTTKPNKQQKRRENIC